jgi:hypothetical protein
MSEEQVTPGKEQTATSRADQGAAPPAAPASSPEEPVSVQTSPPWGMIVVLTALVLVSIGAIWVLASYRSVFTNPTDITTVLGSWFTVVGSLVGVYFGIKASSDTTDKSMGQVEKEARRTERANQAARR